jgi:hypothetical protein
MCLPNGDRFVSFFPFLYFLFLYRTLVVSLGAQVQCLEEMVVGHRFIAHVESYHVLSFAGIFDENIYR